MLLCAGKKTRKHSPQMILGIIGKEKKEWKLQQHRVSAVISLLNARSRYSSFVRRKKTRSINILFFHRRRALILIYLVHFITFDRRIVRVRSPNLANDWQVCVGFMYVIREWRMNFSRIFHALFSRTVCNINQRYVRVGRGKFLLLK